MRTKIPELKEFLEKMNKQNKERGTPYAERLVKELNSKSKKNKL